MAIDTYTPADMLGVLESLENEPITFFRDRYFPFEILSDKEEILFDVVDKHRRLAPYVSPLHQGKLMEKSGYSTRMFKPPYLKPKSVIDPNEQLRRRAGESLIGDLTPEQRRDAQIRECLIDHEQSITMREEVQCSEALRLGRVTVTGEGYGTVLVAFGRHNDLTVTLTSNDRWSHSSQDGLVIGQLEGWALLVRQKSGGAIVKQVTMAPDAWAAFKTRLTETQLKMLFDSLRGSSSRVELGPRLAEKVRYEGSIGEFDFWTYSDTYLNEDGTPVDIMPSGSVVMAGTAIEGTRCYGAIRDVRVLRALRLYPKMWVQEDPSAEYLMTQSAPLMVPLRPNASLGATVL